MKTLALCICSIAFAVMAPAQPPPPPPPPAAPSPALSASATASVSPGSNLSDKLHQKLDRKLHGKHGIVIGDDGDLGEIKSDDVPEFVLPIVVVSLLTVFGAPVLIVALIMYFGFSKNRAMHRTIRMMAEKGQPIPAALLAPPTPAVRQRSDMRRGVVLSMIGIGMILFLGAVNDWEGGAWSFGLIPFLIGAGYLLVWKLEGGGKKNEIPPPPTAS